MQNQTNRFTPCNSFGIKDNVKFKNNPFKQKISLLFFVGKIRLAIKQVFLKYKLVFICSALFLIILGLILPDIVRADPDPENPLPAALKLLIWGGGALAALWGGGGGVIDTALKFLLIAVIGVPVTTFFLKAIGFHIFLMAIILPFVSAFLVIAAMPPDGVIQGWLIVRDMVNATFIVILTWIGIAVILRIKEYEMGKILPIAILMIILVQFTPPIVNIIVETSNDIAQAFLAVEGGTFAYLRGRLEGIATQAAGIWDGLINPRENIGTFIARIISLVLFSVYLIFSALIYLVFLLLFLFRVIMIWLLFVIAPVAFASYIIPQTRGFWTQWWNQLIQWSILPIFLGFGMWMTNHLLRPPGGGGGEKPRPAWRAELDTALLEGRVEEGSAAGPFYEFLKDIMVPFFALGFLIGAIILAIKSSAFGAGAIMSVGNSIAMITTGVIKGRTGSAVMNRLKAQGKGISEGIKGFREAAAKKGGTRMERIRAGVKGGFEGFAKGERAELARTRIPFKEATKQDLGTILRESRQVWRGRMAKAMGRPELKEVVVDEEDKKKRKFEKETQRIQEQIEDEYWARHK